VLEAHVERIGQRRLKCGRCGRKARVRSQMGERRWQDLRVLVHPLVIVYAPSRVSCPRCGVRMERVPWATPWARVTRPLGCLVAILARKLCWKDVAELCGLNWKTVVGVVRWAVDEGLKRRQLQPVRVLSVDEVSRRKGQKYFSLFYDLKRQVLLWIGEDRTEATTTAFFDWFGRRARSLRAVCLDMWAPYVSVIRERAAKAVLVFDRFHLIKHLNEAVDEVRRAMVRELKGEARDTIKGSRYLWLMNPWNLRPEAQDRLRDLVRQHLPITKAYLLKEAFRRFWSYRERGWAQRFLRSWFWMATHSRLTPMRNFAWLVRRHEEGLLAWIDLRISNGAVEGMNNKIKLVAKRAYGFRTSTHFKLAIYHCCANLPLPT
jgi:transposase